MHVGGTQFMRPSSPYHQLPWSCAQPGPMQVHSMNSFQGKLIK